MLTYFYVHILNALQLIFLPKPYQQIDLFHMRYFFTSVLKWYTTVLLLLRKNPGRLVPLKSYSNRALLFSLVFFHLVDHLPLPLFHPSSNAFPFSPSFPFPFSFLLRIHSLARLWYKLCDGLKTGDFMKIVFLWELSDVRRKHGWLHCVISQILV